MEFVVRIIKNIWFYIGFLGLFSLIMVTTKTSVFSFNRFPGQMTLQNVQIGEIQHIPKKYISDIVVGLGYGNITYGSHGPSTFGGKIAVDDLDSLLSFTEQMKGVAETSLKSLLQYSSDRQRVLDLYMKKTTELVQDADAIVPTLQVYVINLDTAYQACRNQKKTADAYVIQGINSNNGSVAETSMQDSINYGECETKFRIQLNTYVPIRKKIIYYQGILAKRKVFLEKNYNLLISSDELFQSGVLEDMVQVRDSLN